MSMNVVIVGAGPAGLFLAQRLLLLNPNYRVQVYDGNSDPIDSEISDQRGFGLGLGAKIQHWLSRLAGLEAQLAQEGVEFAAGGLILISRRRLCALLLRSLLAQSDEVRSRLSLNFGVPVVDVNLTQHEIQVQRQSSVETVAYDLLVGADGIHSIVRSAMMKAHPDTIDYQQRQRPQVWKVLQLPIQPELPPSPPRIIRLQTRRAPFGLVFGACLPQKEGSLIALIFWQPVGEADQINPCGITSVAELEQLLQEMTPKRLPALKLDRDQATTFLATQPGHEYWSQCRRYHDLEGQAVLIGDAAHGLFSLLGQGCTAAIGDAVALSSLLQQHSDQWSIVLPQFSIQQVAEGQAASDLSLLALIFYDRWLGWLYKITTLIWVFGLRQPSIFARLNQVNASYQQVLRENQFWVGLARKQLASLASGKE